MDEPEIEVDEEVLEEEGYREKIKKLREDLKVCKKDKEDYLAGWQRAKADFINARKEEEKSREAFVKFANSAVLNDFLAVADSLDMAMKHSGESDGIKQIYSQLKDILKKNGVTLMETEGQKFNPTMHEAIGEVEAEDEKSDDMVIEEMQKGWMIYEKVLRPAKVKIGNYSAKGGSA
mgnify:CR=1 FL=1